MFQIVDKIFLKKFSTTSKFNHNEFSTLKTNLDRFKYVWNYDNQLLNNEYNEFINLKLKELSGNETKDLEKAVKYREEGNSFYLKKQFNDALIKYNLSLKYSPLWNQQQTENNNSNNLALTYSNRSALFYEMKKYQLSIDDIEMAFKYNYPLNTRHKLIERKIDCLVKLNKLNDAILYLKSILNNKNEMNLNEELIKKLDKKLLDLETEAVNTGVNLEQISISARTAVTECNGIMSENQSVKIDFNENEGNHIKSSKQIGIGEVVLEESPYASVLIKEFISTNCYNCMKKLLPSEMNITYCNYCVNVTYCSEACSQIAWQAHHSHECKYFKLIIHKFGISHMEHLALRIILKANYSYLKTIKNDLINFENEYEAGLNQKPYKIDSNKSYDSNDYLNIFCLITHSNKRVSSDLVRRSMVAGLLTKFLIKTKYFENNEINESSDDFYFIGGLILRHLQSISCNAHEINEFQHNTYSLATSTIIGVGAGIYAALSLFNHSCDPHVTRNFIGTKCILRTIKLVKENEEIFDNYGKLYAVNDFDDRQYKLQDQYFFNCKCVACENKWPLYDKLSDDITKIKYRCDTCLKPVDNIDLNANDCCLEFLDKLKNIKHRVEKDKKYCQRALKDLLDPKIVDKKLDDYMEKFIRYLTIIDLYVHTKPFQDFNDCQEALKQCFNLFSNKHVFTKTEIITEET